MTADNFNLSFSYCLGIPNSQFLARHCVATGIIAKLPVTWRDFATTLKHKREDIFMEDLVTAVDVEEKAWDFP